MYAMVKNNVISTHQHTRTLVVFVDDLKVRDMILCHC